MQLGQDRGGGREALTGLIRRGLTAQVARDWVLSGEGATFVEGALAGTRLWLTSLSTCFQYLVTLSSGDSSFGRVWCSPCGGHMVYSIASSWAQDEKWWGLGFCAFFLRTLWSSELSKGAVCSNSVKPDHPKAPPTRVSGLRSHLLPTFIPSMCLFVFCLLSVQNIKLFCMTKKNRVLHSYSPFSIVLKECILAPENCFHVTE